MTCFFSGPRHLYIFVSNLRPLRRTLVTSIWPAFLARIVIYIVSSVTHVRQGGLLLHPSATYIRQGGISLLVTLPYPLKEFRYLDRLVGNVHPSRRNLVTLPYPLKGFRYLDRLVGNVHPSKRNLVTCYFALST